jgi:hypothetical protein
VVDGDIQLTVELANRLSTDFRGSQL